MCIQPGSAISPATGAYDTKFTPNPSMGRLLFSAGSASGQVIGRYIVGRHVGNARWEIPRTPEKRSFGRSRPAAGVDSAIGARGVRLTGVVEKPYVVLALLLSRSQHMPAAARPHLNPGVVARYRRPPATDEPCRYSHGATGIDQNYRNAGARRHMYAH